MSSPSKEGGSPENARDLGQANRGHKGSTWGACHGRGAPGHRAGGRRGRRRRDEQVTRPCVRMACWTGDGLVGAGLPSFGLLDEAPVAVVCHGTANLAAGTPAFSHGSEHDSAARYRVGLCVVVNERDIPPPTNFREPCRKDAP